MTFEDVIDAATVALIDTPADTIAALPSFVNEAVLNAENAHNFRYMENVLAANTVAGTRALTTLPTGWKEAGTAPYITLGSDDQYVRREIDWAPSASEMVRNYSDDSTNDRGEPEFVLETPTGFEVYPYPDDVYALSLPYYKYSQTLVFGVDNTVTLPVFGGAFGQYAVNYTTALASIHAEDTARAERYFALAQRALAAAVRRDKMSRLPQRVTLYPRQAVYGRIAPRGV